MQIFTTSIHLLLALASFSTAQQYAGDFINNSLPQVPGAEITYFRIPDPAGKNNNLTLINYYSRNSTGQRIVESKIRRAVIVIHGLNRDPGTYESNALSALNQVTDPNINFDSVAIIAPYFPNGDDKNVGYPWTAGLAAGLGSTTNALVWPGSQWSAGGNAQYPNAQKNTISSYYVLDTLVKYFDNATLFPNVKQIVVAGHSLGAQTVQRYVAIGNQLNTRSPITYWVANPNSYVWMNTTRPFDTSSCPTYDVYREGYTNFTQYPMTYATSLVAQGRTAILSNFNSKGIAYARGLQDLGDDSSSCAPFTTGGNRNERFFNFIKTFPPACTDPTSRTCDTIDFVNVGHDSGQMMASTAGQARLFIDNFYGDKKRAFDFGYPRIQAGDDPFPDPSLNGTVANLNNNTYSGNMTYYGCYSDQTPPTLPFFAYDNSSNSIEFCTQTCNSLNYSIAGLEYGSQCFCGSALSAKAQRVVESSCSFACASNANETCGGFSRISIFSRGAPAQLPPPNDPDTLGTWNFWNCYTEGVNVRALGDASMTSNTLTLDSCAAFCKNYKYFGTEYGSECYCGNAFGAGANVTNKNDCNMLCSGNNIQLCGASYRLSVYVQPSFNASASISAPAASSTGGVTPVQCPDANGTTITSNGSRFLVECYVDHLGGDLNETDVSNFQQCIDLCATTAGCVDVSLSGIACYLKSTLGDALQNANIWGAKYIGPAPSSTSIVTTLSSTSKATSTSSAAASTSSALVVSSSVAASTSSALVSSSSAPSSSVVLIASSSSATSIIASSSITSATPSATPVVCPTANNTIVAVSGSNFLVECFVDRYGGDMSNLGVDNFLQCITACATTKGCVDVSLAGTTCYMKNQLGDAGTNSGIWGARYLGPIVSTSSIASVAKTSSGSAVVVSSSTVVLTSSTATSSSVSFSSTGAASSSSAAATSSASTSAVATTSPAVVSTVPSPVAASAAASPTPTVIVCPASNGTTVTTTNGTSFLVECSADHYGADLSLYYFDYFFDCINKCGATTGCVSLAYNGNACYLKSSIGATNFNSAVWGAKMVQKPALSSSAAVSTSSVVAASSPALSSSSLVVSTPSAISSSPAVVSSSQVISSSAAASISSSAAQTSSSLAVSSSSKTSPTTVAQSSSTTILVSSSTSVVLTSSTTSSAATTSSSTPAFSYVGCYVDGQDRALPVSAGSSSTQTPQQCALTCQGQGYKYSGTEYSSECWCSNTAPSTKAPDSDCSSTCSGDAKQQCGGGLRLSVMVDNKWTPKLFARQSFKTWSLAGCYADAPGSRSLPQAVDMPGGGSNATIANCLSACTAKGFTWCGAEYYSECYGSMVAPTSQKQAGNDALAAGCNYACSGNSTEACGGAGLITVYINNGTAS